MLLLAGLRVLVSGDQPLGGVVAPSLSVSAPVVALARAAPAVVGAAGGLTRLFDTSGYSRVGGAAALLPRGTSSPEAVREAVASGARAVLVDGPLPAGALGTDGPADVPILGLSAGDAEIVRSALRRAIPVTLAVGAAAFDPNAALGDAAPFSSEGLAFDGGPKPEVSAAGIGLATSDPGRNEDGAARYGTLSGSSAAAALTAGAAALLAQARPDLDAAGLKQALVASSRRTGGAAAGRVDPSGAAAVELVADPPTVGLGVALAENADVGRIVTLRNVSRRALELTIEPGTADAADIEVDVIPRSVKLRPGASVEIAVSARVPLLPKAPAALGGALRVKIKNGARLLVPWTVAVPLAKRDLIRSARLSSKIFAPSDVEPAVLTVIAGRVDGSAERPQLLPLEALRIDLYRGDRRLGRLALVRDVLPGRYSFGITGRGVDGRRLPRGACRCRYKARWRIRPRHRHCRREMPPVTTARPCRCLSRDAGTLLVKGRQRILRLRTAGVSGGAKQFRGALEVLGQASVRRDRAAPDYRAAFGLPSFAEDASSFTASSPVDRPAASAEGGSMARANMPSRSPPSLARLYQSAALA